MVQLTTRKMVKSRKQKAAKSKAILCNRLSTFRAAVIKKSIDYGVPYGPGHPDFVYDASEICHDKLRTPKGMLWSTRFKYLAAACIISILVITVDTQAIINV